jgi:sugar lactone lactonase YvrE
MPTTSSRPRHGSRRVDSSLAVPVACLALASALAIQASSPRFFRAATPSEFLEGEVENLSLDDRGQLTLGPAVDTVYEAASPFLWSVIAGPSGSLVIGTGNEGRVYRIDAAGNGSLVFDATELDVHALAAGADGLLYAGTSPDGRIYRIDQSGAATPFFDPDERYIWALAVDPAGVVYAGVGEAGAVYRITPDGSGTRFYQAGAVHVTALAFDGAGNLMVGTGSPGRVLRVDAGGRAFLLLDSPYREISALRFDDKHRLFVAATNGSGSAPPSSTPQESTTTTSQPGAPVAIVTTEVTSMSVSEVQADASTPASAPVDTRLARGAIYRIAPDGLWDTLWEPRDDVPYDLAFDAEGRLMVATGNQGKIFRLDGDPPQPALVARAAAQQVTALHRDAGGRLHLATANPGKLLRLSAERATQGTYESAVYDAGTVATWGRISWRASTPAGSRVAVHTRSGNTKALDDTWSTWSPAYADAGGSLITSPNARYLQWRAVLSGKGQGPALTSVSAAYLQRNLRPQVQSITVHPPGIVFQRPFTSGEPELAGFEDQSTLERRLSVAAAQQGGSGTPTLGRRAYEKGLQTLVWRAADENDDDLTFAVHYRREGEAAWKTLRSDLTVPLLVWDTTTVPNGTYFVRVVASDALGNDPALALAGELVSQAFEIDNTPPRVSAPVIKADGPSSIVTFEVADDHSPIRSVEYSLDGMQWRSVFPVDGLADSRLERYEIRVPGGIDSRGVSIRASDTMNNGAAAQAEAAAGAATR